MTTVHPILEDAPVVYLIGHGYRPAYQPADFIGPRLDCPMWLPTADSDAAYAAKWEAPADKPDAPVTAYTWGTWIPAPAAPQITAASLAGPSQPAVWHPVTPSQPWWPSEPNEPEWPCCVIREPDYPLPEPSPVPLPASGGLLLVAIAALWMWRRK